MIDINSRNFNLSLVFLIAINIFPHIFEYTIPVLLVSGSCILWRVLFEYHKVQLPKWPIKLVLVILCMGFIYNQYGTLVGLEAGIVGIIMGVSLKLIDRNTYHDKMVILFLVFIVLLSLVLKEQSLWVTIFAIIDVIIITGLLLQTHSHKNLIFNPMKLLTTGSKLFLKAMPLMVLLFIVFPRLSYKLNILPGGSSAATSGFSETVDPGSVSGIALSDKVAFRVKIVKGPIPSLSKMYWRGAVLNKNTKGLKWKIAKKKYKKNIDKNEVKSIINNVVQKILLPPRFKDWLFTLDSPYEVKSVKDKSLEIIHQDNIGYYLRYRAKTHNIFNVSSSPNSPKTKLTIDQISNNTRGAESLTPKVASLLRRLQANTTNVEQLAYNILEYFSKNYAYTLNPPELGGNQLESFLLNSNEGFCEHFAASFAVLIRAGGYPARLVAGFQGGEVNKYDGMITVKDRDAHAWAEVWSESSQSWLRYDPTQVVAPLRISLGGQAYHEMINDILNSDQQDQNYWLEQRSEANLLWLNQLDQILVTLSTRWTQFLIDYDRSKQIKLFERLGVKKISPYLLIFISLIVFLVFYFWVKSNVFKRKKISGIDKFLNNIYFSLEKYEISKKWNESPETYFNRVSEKYPDIKKEVLVLKSKVLIYKYSSYVYSKQELNQIKLDFKRIKNNLRS